ncbi:asparagine synthase-related protein [Nocardia sp. NPDC051570]|uniref:asparagine synthase-related protein n=1 Tax=Nocardia sp. NPDC051570 TaxID=3364324 RepID=UPI0037ADFB3A
MESRSTVINLAVLNTLPSWFVVLPDHPSATALVSALRVQATREISHPSGRPWLLGRLADGAVTIGEAGDTRIAMFGQHAVTTDQLIRAAGRVRTVADVDRLAASAAGSFHLVASVAGRVRVQGTIGALRQVFHARVDDVDVAADRADVLAGMLGAEIDEQRLASYLLDPFSPYPLGGTPVWRGVTLVPTAHYVVLEAKQPARTIKWWSAPEPLVPMAEGAPVLRDALAAAVEVRGQGRTLLSCDLAGLDSTSLCCLAARGRAEVVAYTGTGHSPLSEDVAWATRTLAGLGTVEHHVISRDRVPLLYDGLLDMNDPLDHPCSVVVDRNRGLLVVRQAAARGSRLHFAGFGGDELLSGSPAYLHGLIRTHPVAAWRDIRGFSAKRRWPRRLVLRQLWDTHGYGAWLAGVADNLVAPRATEQTPRLNWGLPSRLPPWATPAAVAAVRDLIHAAARTAEPLAPRRGAHSELNNLQITTGIFRQYSQLVERLGVTLALPYYDDRVIEAALAVRPQDRVSPWRYKPLIKEAMRGIVPDETLTRQTKDISTSDEVNGFRRHRGDLLALWEDSRLARLGLIDAATLHELCRGPLPAQLGEDSLRQTLACEVWLRSLEGSPVPVEMVEG